MKDEAEYEAEYESESGTENAEGGYSSDQVFVHFIHIKEETSEKMK